jgi:hypothetical protein
MADYWPVILAMAGDEADRPVWQQASATPLARRSSGRLLLAHSPLV